jgi:nucleotide-binding universal stress UspA family protein
MKRIVVATDFSEHAHAAGRIAVALARRKDASVLLVHGLHLFDLASIPLNVRERYANERAVAAERHLADERARLSEAVGDSVPIDTLLRRGDPAPEMLALLREQNTDLLAIGTRGHDSDRRIEIGSVALRLSRQASCPVLVARADHRRKPSDGLFRSPLVAIDYSKFSERAARLAAEVCEPRAIIEMLHVYHAPEVRARDEIAGHLGDLRAHELDRLRELAARIDLAPLEVHYRAEIGPVAAQIYEYVHESNTDVLIIGAHGRDKAVELIGSVADRLLHVSPVPVIVIPEAAL